VTGIICQSLVPELSAGPHVLLLRPQPGRRVASLRQRAVVIAAGAPGAHSGRVERGRDVIEDSAPATLTHLLLLRESVLSCTFIVSRASRVAGCVLFPKTLRAGLRADIASSACSQ